MTPEQESELQQLRDFKELYDLQQFKQQVEAQKQPTPAQMMRDREQQFRTMAKDVEDAVNSTITRITILYTDKMISIPIDVPELASLYDDALSCAVVATRKIADEFAAHAEKLEAEQA